MNVGIVACSNGLMPDKKEQLESLKSVLHSMGQCAVCSPHLFANGEAGAGKAAGTARERAADLMACYREESIGAIYDVSGGDFANETLPLLNYEEIGTTDKLFWGYSDLTTIINAIYAKTGKPSVLYQVRNLVRECGEIQRERFGTPALFDFSYELLRGSGMSGIVVGGNLRCFLKLAGTPYWPDLSGKILLLEALGGEEPQLVTLFSQLEQVEAFEQVAGVLLGTFTAYEKAGAGVSAYELLRPHLPENLPVARTREVGHGADARAVMIGAYKEFR